MQKEASAIYAVEMENISKTFPGGVEANKDITLRIRQGEVHGLLGENGAGKTTLMNILYGFLARDEGSGSISINGEVVDLESPEDAIRRGVGMVHQHFKLIPPLTVTENVMMGYETPSQRPNLMLRLIMAVILLFMTWMFFQFIDFFVATILTALMMILVILAFKADTILTRVIKSLYAIEQRYSGVVATVARSLSRALSNIRYGVRCFFTLGITDAEERIRVIAEENGLVIDPKAKVRDISVGLQQRVEIIKALYREAEILILDEPTSVLTPQEVDELFVTLQKFRDAGKTIILITHKLREPMALCDRISVLRDGELVGTVDRDKTSPAQLAKMMVGREVVFRVEKSPPNPGDVILRVEKLVVEDIRGALAVENLSFELREAEILGIAGVEGNGQTELVEALVGLTEPESGRILVRDAESREFRDIAGHSPRKVREEGIAHIPEDRQKRGLVQQFSVEENLALGSHYQEPIASSAGLLSSDRMRSNAKTLVETYSIKVADVADPASTLSGGNQQKLVVARELSSQPRVLIAAQPTRGLDVGATEYIHNMLVSLRDSGVGVLLISAELDEIRSLSDRIAVIFNGRIVAERDPDTTTAEELGLLMAGHAEVFP